MTVFTVRDATTLGPISTHDTVNQASVALDLEHLVWQVHPSRDDVLRLVVTADDQSGLAGSIVVWFVGSAATR